MADHNQVKGPDHLTTLRIVADWAVQLHRALVDKTIPKLVEEHILRQTGRSLDALDHAAQHRPRYTALDVQPSADEAAALLEVADLVKAAMGQYAQVVSANRHSKRKHWLHLLTPTAEALATALARLGRNVGAFARRRPVGRPRKANDVDPVAAKIARQQAHIAAGRCPYHGIDLPQIGFDDEDDPDGPGIIVQCPRNDCEFTLKVRPGDPAWEAV